MRAPKEHLAYLLKLAAEPGARERRELVRELADLLSAWPIDYPVEARASFAALLARAEHDIDPEARRALAIKLARCADAPLPLLNEFFFDLPPEARDQILARDAEMEATAIVAVDEAALIAAARSKRGTELAQAFGEILGIDALTAMEVLQDASGTGIAIACHGAGVSRAAFSTLAVLTARADATARLAAFDCVPQKGATAILAFWRKRIQHAHPVAA